MSRRSQDGHCGLVGNSTDLGSLRQQHHRAGDLAGVAVDEPPLGAAHIFLQRNRRKRGGFVGKARDLGSSGVQKVAICLPSTLEKPSNLFKS